MRLNCGVFALSAAAALAASAGSASAVVVPFIAEWANSASGATAVAYFDLDIADVNANYNPGSYLLSFAGSPLSNFTITVAGASSGNGTWVQSDFGTVYLVTTLALNPLVEWVGQPQAVGTWGTNTNLTHDFNIFASTAGGPIGTWYYELTTNEGLGETLFLTSFRPVPAPAGVAVLGLTGLVAVGRRRR